MSRPNSFWNNRNFGPKTLINTILKNLRNITNLRANVLRNTNIAGFGYRVQEMSFFIKACFFSWSYFLTNVTFNWVKKRDHWLVPTFDDCPLYFLHGFKTVFAYASVFNFYVFFIFVSGLLSTSFLGRWNEKWKTPSHFNVH